MDLPKPEPAGTELLIRVLATTVNSADWRVRSLTLPRGFGLLGRAALGWRGPRQPILGTELAGLVEAVGGLVTNFNPGDAVFAFPGARMGCHAQYRCVAADGPVALKPARLSFEQAAALCFGGSTMLDFYRRAALRPGERVLVIGASGTVGSAAVQLAKHRGAHVTGVCSTAHVPLVQSIGADVVLDRAQVDFCQPGPLYDVIIDAAGTAPYARCAPVLARGGRLVRVLAELGDLLREPWQGRASGRRVIAGPVAERPEYVRELAGMAAMGAFTPVIDHCFSWDAMCDAHRRVDSGTKTGSVVVTLAP